VWLLGQYFSWKLNQIIVLGFAISLSSTAVIIKILLDKDELGCRAGRNVLGILLVQDIIIVPMLIIINYLGGKKPDTIEITRQIIGGIVIIGVLAYILKKKEIKLPFKNIIEKDYEIQVFVAFTLCFGLSVLTSFFHLSAALGAFIAGILITSTKSTRWVYDSLHAFKIIFVALFFVYIGMLIDLNFLKQNFLAIIFLALSILIINSFINIVVMRIFGESWKDSIYGGALLAQIGEFSFILITSAYYLNIISDYVYQVTVSVIALSLLASPFWITIAKKITKYCN
jgi:CPA2 family monovalent cation:H+ antiporter-2